MSVLLVNGNALSIPLADNSVHCVVCSPPYWGLRDYGISDQLGLEPTPELYVEHMVAVFREVRRVLRPDGTCWLNLGDSYNAQTGSGFPGTGQVKLDYGSKNAKRQQPKGIKPKDLVGIPWMVAFALRADGWWLRSDIIWAKPNPMPESVTDRPTKSHEYLFLLSKSANYFYDADAVRENYAPATFDRAKYPTTITSNDKRLSVGYTNDTFYEAQNPAGRNRRTVWSIATDLYPGSHYATYPRALVEPCIKAGTSERGVCPQCKAPWERVTERTIPSSWDWRKNADEKDQPGVLRNDKKKDLPSVLRLDPGKSGFGTKTVDTTGWRPTCACGIDTTIPATVFDPFCGSGTTLLVARQLGRNGIGLDLSLPYLREQARERLGLAALEEWTQGKKNGKAGELEGLPMFEGQL